MHRIACGVARALAPLLLVAALPAVAAGVEAGPAIARFHAALVGVMKEASALGVQGRYDRLRPEIESLFHLPLMIRVASGGHWNEASEGQRTRLIAAFTRLSVSTYASRFKSYSGESFEIVGERNGPQNTRLIDSRIVRPDDSPVSLVYVFKRFDDRWQVVDILLETGISELAVRRSEYARVLRNEGVDGLVALLDRKADELMRP